MTTTKITVEGGPGEPYKLTQVSQKQFRELRLWHWKQYLKTKQRLAALDTLLMEPEDKSTRGRTKAQMNHHMKAVQTINDLFPQPGDTADRDLETETKLNAKLQ